ncbi:STAS domain-containing protein [Fodinicola acaciae]|uniref:STAS domain-containing protein n=1 Tax=Fodinicola acaciae TaxID=2681555 RepID=UPI0013D2F46B|nr:STAS domain-containing protein [Fodinicola acaciae]
MKEPISVAPGDITLDCQEHGAVAVVRVSGDLDLNTSPSLQDYLAERESSPVVIDLRNVAFLGSAGLATLIQSHERAAAAGRPWAVVATGSVVLRPMEATGLLTILNPYPSVDEALSVFSTSGD